ncbi:C40 family peptidase [Streptomyces sp. H27-H1]|uniref:C40 family peptidase n=1 Tax=Streptomyces sp. H27-H1 TaxID=2996461 RepID=UPI00226E1E25|nr:C40 family peptidase [Streptomyces sp. H27-H1]MCY0932485.1 C40 family peptidase [Streptomyces sp. H27-H1]
MSDSTTWRPHSSPSRCPTSGRHRKRTGRGGLTALRTGVTTGVLGTVTAVSPVTAEGASDLKGRDRDSITMELDLSSSLASSSGLAWDAVWLSGDIHTRQAAEARAAVEKAAAKAKAAEKAAQEEAAQEKAAKAKAAKAKAAKAKATKEKAAKAKPAAGKPGAGATAVAAFARAQMGSAYVYGGTGPSGWDCSALVQAAYKAAGIALPRVSQSQSAVGTSVPLNDLRPGDILYWGDKGSAYHVAIYVGGGKFIGAQNPSDGVAERTLAYDRPTGAVRVL